MVNGVPFWKVGLEENAGHPSRAWWPSFGEHIGITTVEPNTNSYCAGEYIPIIRPDETYINIHQNGIPTTSENKNESNPASVSVAEGRGGDKSEGNEERESKAVVFMQSVFPGIDVQLLKSLLAENEGDLEHTIENLLTLTAMWGGDYGSESSGSEEDEENENENIENELVNENENSNEYEKEQNYIHSEETTICTEPTESETESEKFGHFDKSVQSEFLQNVVLLAEVFPELDRAVLAAVLEDNEDNLDRAIEVLLPQTSQEMEKGKTASARVRSRARQGWTAVDRSWLSRPTNMWGNRNEVLAKLGVSPYTRPPQSTNSQPHLSTIEIDSPHKQPNEFSKNSTLTQNGNGENSLPDEHQQQQQQILSLANTLAEPLDFTSRLKFNSLSEQFRWVEPDLLLSVFCSQNKHLGRTISTLADLFPDKFWKGRAAARPSPTTTQPHKTSNSITKNVKNAKNANNNLENVNHGDTGTNNTIVGMVSKQQPKLSRPAEEATPTADKGSSDSSNVNDQQALEAWRLKRQHQRKIKAEKKKQDNFVLVEKKTKPHNNNDQKKSGNSGSSVSAAPKNNYRDQAIYFGELRNRYFMLATKAYLKGDGRGAKELAQKAREYEARMRDAYEKDTEMLFVPSGGRLNTVDLHKLTVPVALNVLERLLNIHKNNANVGNGQAWISVITGVGKHSINGKARIKPAVVQYLNSNGFTFRDNGGVLLVKVK